MEAEVDALELANSPATFAQNISRSYSEPWLPYRWLMYVNSRLMRLVQRQSKDRLLLTAPPRHGKSDLCSIYFPAWYLNQYPDHRIILCAYGDDFAMEWGRKVRDLIEANQDKLSISISQTSKAQDRWDIAGHKGGMKTAGAGGQIVGRGANLLIVDDPIKDRAEAHSVTERDKKWEWWRTTVQSRLEPGAIVVMMHQRWHEDDLAGRILREEPDRWDVVNFPAIAEEEDALGRMPGEALCPERYTENALALIQRSMGATGFSALYQQRPSPEGGGAFKREHFQYWTQDDREGFTYRLEDKTEGTILAPQQECWRFITMDLAVTARQTSDYTVAAVWDVAGWLEPSRLILRDIQRVRIEGAEHVDMVRQLWNTWNPTFIGIEEAMQGTQTIDFARREGIIVIGLKHRSKDKAFRAKDAQLLTEVHRVYFPKRATWLAEFEHELLLFPSGTHDDQVDVFSYAAMEVLRGVSFQKRPKTKTPETVSERAWANVAKMEKQAARRRKGGHPIIGAVPR